MIKINMLSRLNKTVAAALAEIRGRSYSGRNPALGKMINCVVCGLRHRAIRKCQPVYARQQIFMEERFDELGNSLPPGDVDGPELIAAQNTFKGVFGARTVAKKRFHPHPSKKKLQLVQMTQRLYPENVPYLNDPTECMKESRKQAQRLLKKARNFYRKLKRKQQSISRRINFGLARAGSRP